MKKISTTLILLLGLIFISHAQSNLLFSDTYTSTLSKNGVFDKKKSDIEGSPYTSDTFLFSEVVGIEEKLMLRYNAQTDQIEIQKDETNIFNMYKKEEFGTILMNYGKYKLRLINYKNYEGEDIYGYLVELTQTNNTSLLRKDKIILEEEKESRNSFDAAIPSRFIKAKSQYFLELKNKSIIAMPSSKKQLMEMYPNQKEVITKFLKENNLTFKDENDLIKISQYISTL